MIRSSPQRKQSWLNQVSDSHIHDDSDDESDSDDSEPEERRLMLILDVKTRWSSTHQMMREYVSSAGGNTTKVML